MNKCRCCIVHFSSSSSIHDNSWQRGRELWPHASICRRFTLNESKDAESSLQISEQEGNPVHLSTLDTTATYAHWYGRHPWFAFILGSPLLFLVCIAGNCFAFFLFLSFMAEGRTVETSPLIMQVVLWGSRTIAFVPAIGAASLLCWLVSRSGRHRLWALAACCIIALLASCFCVLCTLPQTEPGTGKFAVCFTASRYLWKSEFWYPSQAVAPLIIGALFTFAGRTPKGPAPNAADAEPMRVAA